jgi:hypothetical protein
VYRERERDGEKEIKQREKYFFGKNMNSRQKKKYSLTLDTPALSPW